MINIELYLTIFLGWEHGGKLLSKKTTECMNKRSCFVNCARDQKMEQVCGETVQNEMKNILGRMIQAQHEEVSPS